MNRNLYPLIALCNVIFFLATDSFASPDESYLQTPTTSFISKPANNVVNVGAPVLKVTANVLEGATRYTIELSTSADFTGTILTRTSSQDHQRTLVFSELKYATTYYARAMTDNAPYGKVSKFTTKPEEFPQFVEPISGDNANPVVLKISITPVPDAKTYIVELNSKSDFTGISHVATSSIAKQTAFIFKDMKYNATYFARAKSDVNTKYSPSIRFRTRGKILQRRLWGLTTAAGKHDNGTIFSFSVDSATFMKHHDYLESSEYPNSYLDGSLVHAPDGGFFGNSECTRNGTCANGELFHISPLGEYKVISQPYIHEGSVMLASNNHLYVVDDWINYFQGGIIRLPAEETEFELSHVMFRLRSKVQGRNPQASLIELSDGYLYGMAPYGGNNNHGVIYKIRLDGSNFHVIHHFDQSTSGAYPQSHLFQGSDGYLYGTTYGGGNFDQGTLFKVLPDGTGFMKLVDFNSNIGSQPHGALVEKNKRLYGMAPAGGDYNRGVLFSVNLDGTGYKKLFSFNGVNGDAPLTTPTIVDGYVYGMTTWGGVNGNGVIFRSRLNGSAFEKLHDFTADQGANPTGALLLAEDFFPANTAETANNAMSSNNREANELTVGVFPNPFMNDFTAELKSEKQEEVTVIITDIYGQVVAKTRGATNASVSLGADLGKGIYLLKVITPTEVSAHRIVKK